MSDYDVLLVESGDLIVLSDPDVEVVTVWDEGVLVVQDTDIDVVTVAGDGWVVVQDVGAQGPPGPASEGNAERVEFRVEAGFDIPAFHVVVPRLAEGTVRLADNSVMSHIDRPMWLALTGALAGETFTVLAYGLIEHLAWTWVQGPIYLGEDGELTQTPPTSPDASFGAQLGYAVGAQCMFYERTAPILLI